MSSSGIATHLFVKPANKVPMQSVGSLNLKTGRGIQGDINANPISPRQVLVVRLEDINELSIKAGELRENIVVSGVDLPSFAPGTLIKFVGGASIRLTFYCEPCKRISHLVKSFKSIEQKRGILGVVTSDGEIHNDKTFDLKENAFSALSEIPFERFLSFLTQVPPGKVITYKQVVQVVGVADSYLRAIPKYLQKATALNYPVHRVLDSEGCLIQHVNDQADLLLSEGVELFQEGSLFGEESKARVDLAQYNWHDENIYQT